MKLLNWWTADGIDRVLVTVLVALLIDFATGLIYGPWWPCLLVLLSLLLVRYGLSKTRSAR
jgi:hypothetical protein